MIEETNMQTDGHMNMAGPQCFLYLHIFKYAEMHYCLCICIGVCKNIKHIFIYKKSTDRQKDIKVKVEIEFMGLEL